MFPDPKRYQYHADEDEFKLHLDDRVEDDPYLNQYTSSPRSLNTYKQMLDEDWLEQPLREFLENRIHALTQG